jgi:hypothetical protein
MSPKIKSLICTLSLVSIISTSFAFTNPSDRTNRKDGIDGAIKASFKREFKTAQIVNWDVTPRFTKVTFQIDGNIMFAFYSGAGELLAVTRNILSSQLPMTLAASLKDNYGDYWITDLFEIDGDGSNCYYITIENADRKIVLRSVGIDGWETYDNHRKESSL